ncbi:MAG TPA: FAD-binding oxidoreductase [Pyrinomonadaceae bacterium]|nr:FAD-binding oxidoreductase [Pyrinomonadaceae bacterium]
MHVIDMPSAGVSQTSLAQAISAWRRAIGDDRVITDTARYNVDTSSFSGRIPVALRPTCTAQVQHVVRIAQRFSIPIYPISTGHNWGYGTSVPVRPFGAIVDLSSMNRIIDFDCDLGVVTLEPGVTQGQVSEFLRSRDLQFMVPVTGAGPSCSIVANALERGFGITPITDHFGAVISMKVVLPDGEIYESYTRTFNAAGVAHAFKWATGPYLDGLFSQSNLGIVVDASIALQPKAERSGALFFVLDDVEGPSEQITRLLAVAGQNIGAINVMSRSRVECMASGAQRISLRRGLALPDGAWFGFGSVYGSREHFRATCRLVKRYLRGHARQVRVYTAGDLKRLRWASALASKAGWSRLGDLVHRLQGAIEIVDGVPSTVALPLAYAKSGKAADDADLNPARDGCGLFWYAPIVPMRRGVVEQFIEFAERTCSKHRLLAPITLTALSPRCYASTIPLLFDRSDPNAERRARMCFEELYEEGLTRGFVPYRIGSQFMPALACNGASVGPVVKAIKHALDPNNVLAPGRYSFD